jgi:XapX domain-containing protein
MTVYLMSLGAGLLVGVIYNLINVRSPAPPAVALIGLLGILLGEQMIAVGKQLITGTPLTTAWNRSQCTQHLFGKLPGRQSEQMKTARATLPKGLNMANLGTAPDLILRQRRFVTRDRANPTASAVAIKNGKFAALGCNEDILRQPGAPTKTVGLRYLT